MPRRLCPLAIPPPPHSSVGPPATAQASSPPRVGLRAIISPRGALLGCGSIDTLVPGMGSGPWGNPDGGVAGAGTASITTTTTSPGRDR